MKTFLYLKRTFYFFFSLFLFFSIYFQPALASEEKDFSRIYQKAIIASRDGDFLNALDYWDQLIKIRPDDPLVLSNHGNTLLALGDAKGAIIDQTRAIEILPDEFDPRLNRGMAEENLYEWDKAENDYRWILQRDSNNSSALYNLANVKIAQGNWKEAEILFEKASLSGSDFAIATSSRALALYQLGQLDEAELELRKLIRRHPMFADARASMTAILWAKGSFGEAESYWASASGLDTRYRDSDWLLNIRRWPPQPVDDLMHFLNLEQS